MKNVCISIPIKMLMLGFSLTFDGKLSLCMTSLFYFYVILFFAASASVALLIVYILFTSHFAEINSNCRKFLIGKYVFFRLSTSKMRKIYSRNKLINFLFFYLYILAHILMGEGLLFIKENPNFSQHCTTFV